MERSLRRMKKIELMELLLEQEKEIEQLRGENDALKAQVDVQRVKLEQAGSIAEAALQLSGIFEAAQKAADLYINSVKSESEGETKIEDESDAEQTDDIGDRNGAAAAAGETAPTE